MSNKSNEQPIVSAATHDRAFLQTVLRLHGVSGTPTDLQLERANRTVAHYGLKVLNARKCDLAYESDWLTQRMPEQAAIERAFLFVKFDSVMNMTAAQGVALHDWLGG